ncbi:MAG: sulfatase-like hydrolase/transferase, partial [Rubripirellula sp.]
MNSSSLIQTALYVVMLALAPTVSIAAADETTSPNIILLMSDDQGWGDVGFNGNDVLQTQHLDSMAAAGVRFDRFYAAAPLCSPT